MQQETEGYYQLIIWGSFLLFILSFFIVSFILLYNQRHKRFQEKEALFQQTLLQTQLEIQEQTLKNISQEIHDNVGQVLTLAKLNLATSNVEDPASSEKIKTSQKLIGKAIQDLRDLSRSLNTDYVERMGLVHSIGYELEMLKKTGSMEALFKVEGTIVKLDQQKELILFRIVQEAIHNIIRHATAKTISAVIQFDTDKMKIIIKDDGIGFDLSPLNDSTNNKFGLGLRNMQARATLIGALFSINSTIGSGTEIKIDIPFNEIANESKTKN